MKRSPLKRGTSQLKRTPLARVGKRGNSKKAERANVVAIVRARDKICQLPERLADHCEDMTDSDFNAVMHVMCHGPLDVHEIIPRSAWPDGELVESNCQLICRRHHEWVDAHPAIAHQIGLHGYSWERT